jgi:hypothetical protein
MTRKRLCGFFGLTTLAMLTIGLLSVTAAGSDDGGAKFEVTITNLTRGQTISRPVVATHTRNLVPLFTLGSPASPELVAVAEDANTEPLVARLSAGPSVKHSKSALSS